MPCVRFVSAPRVNLIWWHMSNYCMNLNLVLIY